MGLYGRRFPLRSSGITVFTPNQNMGGDFCAGYCADGGHKCTRRIHSSQLPNFKKWPSSSDWTNTLGNQCDSISITKDKKGEWNSSDKFADVCFYINSLDCSRGTDYCDYDIGSINSDKPRVILDR